MKESKKLTPLQELFVKKPNFSTKKLREFYGKMVEDPDVPVIFKGKRLTPERVASDYLEMYMNGYDFGANRYIPALVHEYKENGHNYRLKVKQGTLSDYELNYRATRFILERNGRLVKDTTIGASLFVDIEFAEVLEYARIMYGKETYAHLMELAAKKVEVLADAKCDASDDVTHRRNQRKFNRFMKFDKIARKIYGEVKEINRENEIYEKTQKTTDAKNDLRKIEFEEQVIVNPKNVQPEDREIPPRAKPDTERAHE